MKNLPEDETFKQLENRLTNYSELPDDSVWTSINAAIPKRPDPVAYWSNRVAAVACVITVLWLAYSESSRSETQGGVGEKNKKSAKPFSPGISSKESDKIELTDIPHDDKSSKLSQNNTPVSSSLTRKYSTTKESETPAPGSNKNPGSLSGNNLAAETSEFQKGYIGQTVPPSLEGDIQPDLKSSVTLNSERSTVAEIEPDTLRPVAKTGADSVRVAKKIKAPENLRKKKKTGVSLYAILTPTLSFQNVTPIGHDGIDVKKFANPQIFSGNRSGISLEAGIQKRITAKFEYFGGVALYYQSQHLDYTVAANDKAMVGDGKNAWSLPAGTSQQSVDYKMLNAGAQLGLLYTLQQHTFAHKVGAQINYQVGLLHSSENHSYDNSSSRYLNYTVLYRLEFTMNQRMKFIIQPSFGHTLNANETLNAPFTLKQFRAGIGFGILYHF